MLAHFTDLSIDSIVGQIKTWRPKEDSTFRSVHSIVSHTFFDSDLECGEAHD